MSCKFDNKFCGVFPRRNPKPELPAAELTKYADDGFPCEALFTQSGTMEAVSPLSRRRHDNQTLLGELPGCALFKCQRIEANIEKSWAEFARIM
ncbi:hypothetical protein SAMN05444161_1463 [Rhizobiales bacterium GAS191]|nr:hypothetical protein SAMN05444161_1463 [Rhizobiales bacterium GAS191]